jgi:hypothetical protein
MAAGGYTLLPMEGGWVDEHGDLVVDNGAVVEVLCDSDMVAHVVALVEADMFFDKHEDAVLHTVETVTATMKGWQSQ